MKLTKDTLIEGKIVEAGADIVLNTSLLISAFPGVGKSYFTKEKGNEYTISDSDSSLFSWESKGVRHPDFPNNYMNHIKQKIEEGTDFIFISSHDIVREALVKNSINFYLVYPNKNLKEDFIKRYTQRGSDDKFIDFISKNWEKFIEELAIQESCTKIRLDSLDNIPNMFESLFKLENKYDQGNYYYDGKNIKEIK